MDPYTLICLTGPGGMGKRAILPGLSDRPELLADVVRAARAAGATGIWTHGLNLKPGTREHFLEQLARDWPEELERYERLYPGRRAYLPKEEFAPVRAEVGRLAKEHSIRDRRRNKLEPPREPEQLALELLAV